MIWKDYLKLSEIASYSKLARASKAHLVFLILCHLHLIILAILNLGDL